jgi:hypothetical protein
MFHVEHSRGAHEALRADYLVVLVVFRKSPLRALRALRPPRGFPALAFCVCLWRFVSVRVALARFVSVRVGLRLPI